MTKEKKSWSLPQLVLAFAVILIAAASGIYLGGVGKGIIDNEPEIADDEFDSKVFNHLTLLPDSTLPDIIVYDSAKYFYTTRDLLASNGTIVLFMEAGCPPCHTMVRYLQALIDDQTLESSQVVGISFSEANTLSEMIDYYGLTFKVYADENFAFYDSCGVDAFPLILFVDSSGTILYSDHDSRNQIDKKLIESYFP